MRRVVLMVALALALPTAALANSILDYSNSTGTISASDSSLSITSTITTISVLGGTVLQTGLNLGTLSITAGAMTSGSAAAGKMSNRGFKSAPRTMTAPVLAPELRGTIFLERELLRHYPFLRRSRCHG